jgi:hypothetical protein
MTPDDAPPFALDTVHQGDCLNLLAGLPDASVHAEFGYSVL